MGRLPSFIVCLLCTLVSASLLPSEIEDGYFSGRSGNMILKPKNYQNPDSSIVFLDQTGNIFRNLNVPNEISIYNIADLIGQSFGISPMHQDFSTSDYIKPNFFNRPMANLLIEIDSIGEHLSTDPSIGIELNYLNSLRHGEINGVPMKVVQTSYPANYLSLATSLISGQKPSQHGIIGKMWKDVDGSIIHGYSSKDSWSQVPSLLDIVFQTFHGQSLIVSLSGDEQSAKVNSVNPRFRKSSKQDHIAYFRPNELDFKVSSGHAAIKSTLGELTSRHIRFFFESQDDSILNLLRNHAGVDIKYNEGSISLHYISKDGSRQEAIFDLSIPEDMRLFSELQSSYSLVKVLHSSDVAPIIRDDLPDFFSISFRAVDLLSEKYGQHSTQVVGALHLLDSAIPLLFDRFSMLYPNRLLSEIVFLGNHPNTLSAENSQGKQLISLFNREDVFPDLFPSLYIPRGIDRSLSSELGRIGFQLFSFPSNVKLMSYAVPRSLYLTQETSGNTTNVQNVTSADVAKYQIALWTSVLLGFVAFFAVYSLATMSFKKDTLIYSTFNPKWETRQANR